MPIDGLNNPKKCWVLHTGHEAELAKYSELLAAKGHHNNAFAAYEHKLLLLSLLPAGQAWCQATVLSSAVSGVSVRVFS